MKKTKKEQTAIKNVRNPFRLKQEIDDTAIEDTHDNTVKDLINLYRLKNEIKQLKTE